jgi:hypothetical protein
VSPVKYEVGFYIPEGDILQSHFREDHKSYIVLTDWAVETCVPCEVRTGVLYPQKMIFFMD